MTIIDMVEQAQTCLHTGFGDRWQAPYAEGKAQMVELVYGELQVAHEEAVELIEALERDGRIRFVGVLGIQTSTGPNGPLDPDAQNPLRPHTDTSDVQPDAVPERPVLGDWVFSEPAGRGWRIPL